MSSIFRHPEQGEPGSDYQRGLDALAGKQYREALDIFDRLVARERTAPHLFQRGVARYRLGDRPGARADFTAAIELEPTYADAYWRRAVATDEPRAAIADHDRGIAIHPAHAKAYMERAGVWRRLGNLEKARADIEAALLHLDAAARLSPDDADVLADRAAAHLELQRWEEGQADARRALAIRPDLQRARVIASLSEVNSKDHEEAAPRPVGLANTVPAGWAPGQAKRDALDADAIARRLDILADVANIVAEISTAESRGDAQEGVRRVFRALRHVMKEADLTAPLAGEITSVNLDERAGRGADAERPLFEIDGVPVISIAALPFEVVKIHVKKGQQVTEGQVLCRVRFIEIEG